MSRSQWLPRAARTRIGALLVAFTWTCASFSPAQAASDWTMVSAGGSHTCGIRAGELYCWGYNHSGQIGNHTSGDTLVTTPTRITTAEDWKSVSAGGSHTCAIRSIGKLYCWGDNQYSQVGFFNFGAAVTLPTKITAADDWKSVTAGSNHTCAIRSIGKLYCWGNNIDNEVGFTTSGNVPVTSPTKITSADDWKTVTAGALHTCAIRSVGKLYCWGNDVYYQAGFNNGPNNVQAPTRITSAEDWKSVTAGNYHNCAIRSIGKLYCWGYNLSGQVGNNSSGTNVQTPTKITSADDWKSVTAGGDHNCAIRSIGKLYCWGADDNGQIGFTSGAPVKTPTRITSAEDWTRADGGGAHTCAIRSIGKLYCWGQNFYGQVGFNTGGTAVQTPTQVTSP